LCTEREKKDTQDLSTEKNGQKDRNAHEGFSASIVFRGGSGPYVWTFFLSRRELGRERKRYEKGKREKETGLCRNMVGWEVKK